MWKTSIFNYLRSTISDNWTWVSLNVRFSITCNILSGSKKQALIIFVKKKVTKGSRAKASIVRTKELVNPLFLLMKNIFSSHAEDQCSIRKVYMLKLFFCVVCVIFYVIKSIISLNGFFFVWLIFKEHLVIYRSRFKVLLSIVFIICKSVISITFQPHANFNKDD